MITSITATLITSFHVCKFNFIRRKIFNSRGRRPLHIDIRRFRNGTLDIGDGTSAIDGVRVLPLNTPPTLESVSRFP